MYCKQCGTELKENQDICLNCGVKVGAGNAYCQSCGVEVKPEQDYCLNCGVALKKEETKFLEGKLGGQDKIIIAIVCFFVGGFGIHNFMMGETKKGILRLLTCWFGLGGILALVDFVKILINTYVVDPDKYI